MDRVWAARFSFLLAVPAIILASIFELVGALQTPFHLSGGFVMACLIGAVAAGLTGFFALGLVIKAVSSRIFHRFAWYCVPLGLLVVAWGWFGTSVCMLFTRHRSSAWVARWGKSSEI